jgi:hypothetical protein
MIAVTLFGVRPAKEMPATSSMVAIVIISLAHAVLVWRVLRPVWVATAAEDYARQLLAACDVPGSINGGAASMPPRAGVKKRVAKGRTGQLCGAAFCLGQEFPLIPASRRSVSVPCGARPR